MLNGAKMWITNGTVADVAVVWAKLGRRTIRGFLVEQGTKGFSAPEIRSASCSLRASVTSELVLEDCEVPEENLLPGVEGLKGAARLPHPGALRHRLGRARRRRWPASTRRVDYTKERVQFGKPIGGFQLVQRKLVEMLTEITKAQLLCLQLGPAQGRRARLRPQQVDLAKRNNVRDGARDRARRPADILGANGITDEYPVDAPHVQPRVGLHLRGHPRHPHAGAGEGRDGHRRGVVSGGIPPGEGTMNGPLSGVRVLDLSRVLAGPFCTMVLGDLGAEVIKIERPDGGDDTRAWGPPFAAGESAYYLSVNRNKKSVAVDLKSAKGLAVVQALAARSDVVIENFRVGGSEHPRARLSGAPGGQPGLVYCSISGYGQTGPNRDLSGYDFIIQAMSGLMSITGEPEGEPMKLGVATVDLTTGLYAAVAILAALRRRDASGEGQRIDVALMDSAISWLANVGENTWSPRRSPDGTETPTRTSCRTRCSGRATATSPSGSATTRSTGDSARSPGTPDSPQTSGSPPTRRAYGTGRR